MENCWSNLLRGCGLPDLDGVLDLAMAQTIRATDSNFPVDPAVFAAAYPVETFERFFDWRLLLRTWQSDDAADAFAIWGDGEVMRYVGQPLDFSISASQRLSSEGTRNPSKAS